MSETTIPHENLEHIFTGSRFGEAGLNSRSYRDLGLIEGECPVVALGPEVQSEAASLIEAMSETCEQQAAVDGKNILVGRSFFYQETDETGSLVRPAMNKWGRYLKSATNLNILYQPDAERLGAAVQSADIVGNLRNIFGEERLPYVLSQCPNINDFENYLDQSVDAESRLFFAGCKDGQGIRERSLIARGMLVDHFTNQSQAVSDGIVSFLSIGCGAAVPIRNFTSALEQQGFIVSQRTLVDVDPLALASAKSVLDGGVPNLHPITDTFKLQDIRAVLSGETKFIDNSQASVADLLGILEYFRTDKASALLSAAHESTADGGIIIFGNMLPLNVRPESDFYQHAVQWPGVKSRSIDEVVEIVESAGFSKSDLTVAVGEVSGVYANYGLRVRKN